MPTPRRSRHPHVLDVESLPLERAAEHLACALVQRLRDQDVITCLRQREQGSRDGGLPAGDEDAVDSALEIGQSLAGHGVGRVVVAGVRAPRAPAGEQVFTVVEALEQVPGGLVDGCDASAGLRVDECSRVDLAGLEIGAAFLLGHAYHRSDRWVTGRVRSRQVTQENS